MLIRSNPTQPRLRLEIGLLLLLSASAAYGFFHLARWPLLHDASIFHYIAWRLSQGAVPYRDILDINMPGVYLLHWLALKVFGESDAGFRLFDLSLLALTGAGIAAFCKPAGRFAVTAGVLLFVSVHIGFGAINLAQRDFMLLPFLLFALCLFRSFFETRASFLAAFSCGALLGFACWIKPIAFLLAAMLVVLGAMRKLAVAQKIRGLLGFASGGVCVAAGFIFWLWQIGAWEDFWQTLLGLTLPFYGPIDTLFVDSQWGNVVQALLASAALAGGNAYLLLHKTRLPQGSLSRALLLILLAYGVAHYFLQCKGFSYHFYVLVTGLCCVAAYLLGLGQFTHEKNRHALYGGLALACLWLGPVMQQWLNPYFSPRIDIVSYTRQLQAQVQAAYDAVPPPLRKANPFSLQFMDITQAHLWNVAFRQHWVPVSRHTHPFALYEEWQSPYMDALRSELLSDLRSKRPPVIVISKESWPFAMGVVWKTWDNSPPWKEFFAHHYALFEETDRYRIYRLAAP